MNSRRLLPLSAPASILFMLMGFSHSAVAATATNLVTICLSATTTTQASKCTIWQYNVYSPTAYIESYPQVSPGPKIWTDPAYQYILGSTITPTMGVKVCPTALTPGVTFNSANADPCPNNVLVAASTVLPANSYAVTTDAGGIVVYQVNTSGVSTVPGSPFVPSPVPNDPESGGTAPDPVLTATDPTGQYLYGIYHFGNGGIGGENVYSFNMVNGVPTQLSVSSHLVGDCAFCDTYPYEMVATADHVYVATAGPPGYLYIATTQNGVFTGSFELGTDYSYGSPGSFAVDPKEQFLYWYVTSSGASAPDMVMIYSLNFTTSTATRIGVVPIQGTLTLGAK